MIGETVGSDRITAKLGSCGMGEVYRAHDLRLGRDVAIKFSKEQFSERFEREAGAVAALNHPNICHLYDVGPNYLVMEYVEVFRSRAPCRLRRPSNTPARFSMPWMRRTRRTLLIGT
jgi:serine/threonine protein kinase